MNNILEQNQTCENIAYQPLTVRVPVSVTPFANLLDSARFHCGDPVITPGTISCVAMEGESCIYTITQNICVEIPIEFGATAQVGKPLVDCGCPPHGNMKNYNNSKRSSCIVYWNSPNVIL